jgi:hypothetical protein
MEKISEIEQLVHQLDDARWAIIELMPSQLQAILESFFNCESREETIGWNASIADTIIAGAEILPRDEGSFLGDRAVCPLCKRGGSPVIGAGFSVPEGLRRHLLGWGSIRRCVVTEAAFGLARYHWQGQFGKAEAAEQARRQALVKERKKSERQYRTAPDRSPELIDEGLAHRAVPRDEMQLKWAEDRLRELGFRIGSESNVTTYTREHGELIVYADPRACGEISFTVYRKAPAGRRGRRLSARRGLVRWFALKDAWKHDIREKYECRVSVADGQQPKDR